MNSDTRIGTPIAIPVLDGKDDPTERERGAFGHPSDPSEATDALTNFIQGPQRYEKLALEGHSDTIHPVFRSGFMALFQGLVLIQNPTRFARADARWESSYTFGSARSLASCVRGLPITKEPWYNPCEDRERASALTREAILPTLAGVGRTYEVYTRS